MSYLSYIPRVYNKFSALEQKIFVMLAILGFVGVAGLLGMFYRNMTVPVPALGGHWREGVVGQPTNLNPTLPSASPADQDLRALLHAGLFTINGNGEIIPHLAEELPEVSEDLKSYTVTLRPGLKWQDGYNITSDDVIYTIKNIQNRESGSHLRNLFRFVKMERLDERSVKFTLRDATVTFIENLLINLIPAHLQDAADPNPIGAGPYRIAQVHRNLNNNVESIELEANPFYFPHPPYIEKFTLKFYPSLDKLIEAYQKDKIDGYGHLPIPDQIEKISGEKHLINFPQQQVLFFNGEKSPGILDDITVRKALNLATDRESLIKSVYHGQAQIFSSPEFMDENLHQNTYNPAEAEQLLAEAGWLMSKEGYRFKNGQILEVKITTNEVKHNIKTADLLSEQWKQIGIKTSVQVLSDSEIIEKAIAPREFQTLLLFENIGHDPDPYPFWHSSQIADPGLNFSAFKNNEADKLIIEARINPDTEARANTYRQLADVITSQVPALFLVRPYYVYNYSKNLHLDGLKFITFPYERFSQVHTWHLKTKRTWK